MSDDYFKDALAIVDDRYVLVSMIAGRAKMLRRGNTPPFPTGLRPRLESVSQVNRTSRQVGLKYH
jgi:hypothetical protein